jgi:hypothetical protein
MVRNFIKEFDAPEEGVLDWRRMSEFRFRGEFQKIETEVPSAYVLAKTS